MRKYQTGFSCHPCNGAMIGLFGFAAFTPPLLVPSGPPLAVIVALLALGAVLNLVAGWASSEEMLLYMLGGLGVPALMHWLLSEFAGVDVPSAAGDWRWFVLYAFTLLPAALAGGVELRRNLSSQN